MAKKSGVNILFLAGMAATVIGFFLPVFDFGFFGTFNLIKIFDNLGSLDSYLALISFLGAVLGVVTSLVSINSNIPLKLVALVCSVVVGLIFFIDSGLFDWFKNISKYVGIGFYLIVVGWILSCVGYFSNK